MNVRYPAEWEPQAATWLTWPSNAQNWDSRRAEIEAFYLALIETLSQFQTVCVLTPYGWKVPAGAERLRNLPHSPRFFEIPTNDIWIRDYGPLFVKQGPHTMAVKFEFNSWGEKFPPFVLDNAVPIALSRMLGCTLTRCSPILEGGALEFNGDGLCITTEDCLVGARRNHQTQRKAVERSLKESCGLRSLLVLPGGLHGDHTDGHIDNVARFVAKDRVVMASTSDASSPNYEILSENNSLIKKWLTSFYPEARVDTLPLPPQRVLDNGEVLPASYMNFIYANGALIVPTYACPEDEDALRYFRSVYPDRKVIGIDCRCVIEEGGSLHCMSKQQPI